MREGKAHIADTERTEPLARPVRAGEDLEHALGHLLEAALGHRREQGLPVREVPVGSGLRDARAAGDLAQAEALRPLPGDEGRRHVDEGVAQLPWGAAT